MSMHTHTPLLRRELLIAAFFCVWGGMTTAQATSDSGHTAPTRSATSAASPSPATEPIVLITGGTGEVELAAGHGFAVLDAAEVYKVRESRFLPIASMTVHRDRHAAVALDDGRVLIVGGVETIMRPFAIVRGPAMPWILRGCEIFDPVKGRFDPGADMADARDEPTATILRDGNVLIVGGGEHNAEVYKSAADKFEAGGKLDSSRYQQTATTLPDGKVLIVGGGDPHCEIYDPAMNSFATVAEMAANRIYHTATLMPDGRVLIAGGSSYARSPALDTAEIYDPSSNTVSAGPKMTRARAGHTATLLMDGRVLIAGGTEEPSAEVYDFRANRFTAVSNMTCSRYGHSATMLPDGGVLVAGGWDSNYQPIAKAEVSDPKSNEFKSVGDMIQARAGHSATLLEVTTPITWIRRTPTPTPTLTQTPTPTPTPISTLHPSASATKSAAPASTPTAVPPRGHKRLSRSQKSFLLNRFYVVDERRDSLLNRLILFLRGKSGSPSRHISAEMCSNLLPAIDGIVHALSWKLTAVVRRQSGQVDGDVAWKTFDAAGPPGIGAVASCTIGFEVLSAAIIVSERT